MNLWWRQVFCGLTVVAIALAIVPRARAETFPLEVKRLEAKNRFNASEQWEYVLRRVMPQHFYMQVQKEGNQAYQQEWEKEFSKIVNKEPEKYNSKHPLRGVAKLGSGKYAFVLDDAESESGKCDRLYFDKNQNGDLTDEEPIAAEQTNGNGRQFVQSTFPRIDLTLDVEGSKLDYAFQVSAHAYQQDERFGQISAQFNAFAYREGEVTLEGKKHRLVVLDYNSNGRFGDLARVRDDVHTMDGQIYPEIGDMLLLDPSAETIGYAYYLPTAGTASQYLSKLVNIEGKFYEVTVSPTGDTITLNPSQTPLGQVTNPNPFHAIVYGKQGFLRIDGNGQDPVPLPEGEWKLLSYTINRTEEPAAKEEKEGAETEGSALLKALASLLTGESPTSGPRHTVVTATATKDCPTVKVSGQDAVPLPFGPPYKPVVKVGYGQGTDKVQLQMSLVGSAGEMCQDMQINGQRPGKPSFTITDPDGKEVASGAFEYG